MNALKSLVTSLSSSKAGLAATAGGAVRGPPSAGAVASRTRSYWTIPIRRWLVGTSCGGIHTTKPYASSLCVTTSIMRPFSSTTSVWNRWNGAHGSVGDNHHRLLGATAHQPSWGCSPPPHTHHHQFQQFREMSKYLSKAAKTRLPLTTKRARKGYYKGKGATKEGHLTSTGKFVVDPLKRLQLVVPDLSDFKVRTQYVVCVCVYVQPTTPPVATCPFGGEVGPRFTCAVVGRSLAPCSVLTLALSLPCLIFLFLFVAAQTVHCLNGTTISSRRTTQSLATLKSRQRIGFFPLLRRQSCRGPDG